MEEAAVGMVALDPSGKVTLVNPRAESLLESEVTVGETMPAVGVLGEALAAWLDGYLAGGLEEADGDRTEIAFERARTGEPVPAEQFRP